MARPNPARPNPARPNPARPNPARPNPARPNPARPNPARPNPARPNPARPNPARPNPARPNPARPNPARPNPARPNPARPNPARPNPARPNPARPTPARPAPTRRFDTPLTPIQEALALWDAGQRISALEQLEQLNKWQIKEPKDAYRVAKLYANQQQLKKANIWLNMVLKEAPLFAPAHHLQGVIYSEWGKLDDALRAFRRAIFADRHFILAHFALASLFGRLNQPQRAQKALNKVTQLLATREPDAPLSADDKITAKELAEMVAIQRSLLKT